MADLKLNQKKNIAYYILQDMIVSGVVPEDTWYKYVIENPIECFPKGTVRRFMSTEAIKASEELHPSPAKCRSIAAGGKWKNPAFQDQHFH